jgi:hypothetical protein
MKSSPLQKLDRGDGEIMSMNNFQPAAYSLSTMYADGMNRRYQTFVDKQQAMTKGFNLLL